MTTSTVPQNWIDKSDISSAICGLLFKQAFPSMSGTHWEVALYSAVISIVARILPNNVKLNIGSLSVGQKSQLVIAILGAVVGMYRKSNPLTAAVGYLSIDELGLQLMALLGMSDGSLLGP
jgi:hypothetical protein